MSISIEQIRPNAVFQFTNGPRRVTSLTARCSSGFHVNWEYADGMARGGRRRGSQWVHHFRSGAIAEIHGGDAPAEESRTLLNGRQVSNVPAPVDIHISTRCPAKWAIVDLETGEAWRHDGQQLVRLSPTEAHEAAQAATSKVA